MKKHLITLFIMILLIAVITNISYSKPVTFKFHPESITYKAVMLECEQFGEKKIPMRYLSADKIWTVTIDLPSGRYKYQFVVSENGTGFVNLKDSANKKTEDGQSVIIVD